MRTNILAIMAMLCMVSCGKLGPIAPATSYNTNVVLRISVLQSGKLLADGSEVSLSGLDSKLAHLKTQNGVAWYYREGGQSEPPPLAMDAIKLLAKYGTPVSTSSKADFSDTVDEHGVSKPRK